MVRRRIVKNQKGQAITEYILLIAVIVTFYLIVVKGMEKFRLDEKLMTPVTGDFARAYRYGNVKAKGYDDGGPENHPRAVGGRGNFRIFISPGQR
jgi:uncharacterized protein (UPF0333 family)